MFQPPQRRRRNKAYLGESINRPTSPHTFVFLEAIFSRNGRKIYKISSKSNSSSAWYFVTSTTIIVSMAKETIGIRPDDAISAYNGGKLNFPWPTENLNFAPRMRMLNWRHSPFKTLHRWLETRSCYADFQIWRQTAMCELSSHFYFTSCE